METREGFYYGSDRAVHQGLECPGVVIPRRNTTSPVEEPFDVIVVGAGYAGLTSCRDLCSSGMFDDDSHRPVEVEKLVDQDFGCCSSRRGIGSAGARIPPESTDICTRWAAHGFTGISPIRIEKFHAMD